MKMAEVTCYSTGKFKCRFCGKTDFCIEIFSEHGRKMEVCGKTFFSLGIHLLETDKLPRYICFFCYGKLMDYCMFKQNVLLVQKKLTDDILSKERNNNGVLVFNENKCVIDVTDDSPEEAALNRSNNGKNITAENSTKKSKVESVTSPGPSVVPSPSTSLTPETNNKRPNPSPSTASNKKLRKTVCLDCGKWLTRAEVENHEATVHFRKNFDCLLCKLNSKAIYFTKSMLVSEVKNSMFPLGIVIHQAPVIKPLDLKIANSVYTFKLSKESFKLFYC